MSTPCEITDAAAGSPEQRGDASSATRSDDEARQRLGAIFAFIGAAAEDADRPLPITAALMRDAQRRLADFGRFLERTRAGTLGDPGAQACRLYLDTLRSQVSPAELYATTSVLHLVYGPWPWVPPAQRLMGSAPVARAGSDDPAPR